MFSAPRPEYTCPIKLTLTLPPTEQTSLLQTPLLQQFVWSRGPRNNRASTRGQSDVMLSNSGEAGGAGPFPCTRVGQVGVFGPFSVSFLPLCRLFDRKHLLLCSRSWGSRLRSRPDGGMKELTGGGEGCGTLTGASFM